MMTIKYINTLTGQSTFFTYFKLITIVRFNLPDVENDQFMTVL